jgi:hypothetical protein
MVYASSGTTCLLHLLFSSFRHFYRRVGNQQGRWDYFEDTELYFLTILFGSLLYGLVALPLVRHWARTQPVRLAPDNSSMAIKAVALDDENTPAPNHRAEPGQCELLVGRRLSSGCRVGLPLP